MIGFMIAGACLAKPAGSTSSGSGQSSHGTGQSSNWLMPLPSLRSRAGLLALPLVPAPRRADHLLEAAALRRPAEALCGEAVGGDQHRRIARTPRPDRDG